MGKFLEKTELSTCLKFILDLSEEICGLYSLIKPLQLKSPKKETKERTYIGHLPIHFVRLREMKEHRLKVGKAEPKSY